MTHASNLITTQSHSAAPDSGICAQMLSCYSVVTWMAKSFNEENQDRKEIHWKKCINSEFPCNFLDRQYQLLHISVSLKGQNSFLHLPNLQIGETMQGICSVSFPTEADESQTPVNHGV